MAYCTILCALYICINTATKLIHGVRIMPFYASKSRDDLRPLHTPPNSFLSLTQLTLLLGVSPDDKSVVRQFSDTTKTTDSALSQQSWARDFLSANVLE